MLSRLDIKKILKNVGSVSRSTLIKKANQLGLDVKKNISDDKLRKQVLKEGERQIDRYMDSLIKQYNEEKKQQRENLQYKTNAQGVKINKKDYNELLKLQNEYNNKKERILKNYLNKTKKEGHELSQVELDFLKGKTVRHVNSSENIELNVNFRKENLIDSISKGVDLKYYKKMIKEEIKNFRITNVISNRSRKLNSWLNDWNNSLDLTDKQVKEVQELYKTMNVIEKSQFNKDIEKKLQFVESVSRNPRSRWDVYHLLTDVIFDQSDRDFISN